MLAIHNIIAETNDTKSSLRKNFRIISGVYDLSREPVLSVLPHNYGLFAFSELPAVWKQPVSFNPSNLIRIFILQTSVSKAMGFFRGKPFPQFLRYCCFTDSFWKPFLITFANLKLPSETGKTNWLHLKYTLFFV